MNCKTCGNELHAISGFCLDRDGIRDALFCPKCITVFKVTCAAITPVYVLKDYHAPPAKERIRGALQNALDLLDEEAPVSAKQ